MTLDELREDISYTLVFIYGMRPPAKFAPSKPVFNEYQLRVIIDMVDRIAYPRMNEADKMMTDLISEAQGASDPNTMLSDDIPPLSPRERQSYYMHISQLVNAGAMSKPADYDEATSQLHVDNIRKHRNLLQRIKDRQELDFEEFSNLCRIVKQHIDIDVAMASKPITPNHISIIHELAICGKTAYKINTMDENELTVWIRKQMNEIYKTQKQLGYI